MADQEIDIDDVRRYLDLWGCLAHPGVLALVEKEIEAQRQDEDLSRLPPPSIHAARHYATFLRSQAALMMIPERLVARMSEPTYQAATKQAAGMIDLLWAECQRLHRELVEANGQDCLDAALTSIRRGVISMGGGSGGAILVKHVLEYIDAARAAAKEMGHAT